MEQAFTWTPSERESGKTSSKVSKTSEDEQDAYSNYRTRGISASSISTAITSDDREKMKTLTLLPSFSALKDKSRKSSNEVKTNKSSTPSEIKERGSDSASFLQLWEALKRYNLKIASFFLIVLLVIILYKKNQKRHMNTAVNYLRLLIR